MKRLPTINMVGEYCTLIQELHETVSTLVADPTKADTFFFAQDHGLNVYRMTSADLQSAIQQLATKHPDQVPASPPQLPSFFLSMSATSLSPLTPVSTAQQISTTITTSSIITNTTTTHTTVTDQCNMRKEQTQKQKPSGPPPLAQRCAVYVRLYLRAIIKIITKFDSKFLHGGEYAINPNLHSLHLHTSTRDVERIFAKVDRLFYMKSYSLRAVTLPAFLAMEEAPDDPDHLQEYNKYGVCPHSFIAVQAMQQQWG